MRRSLVVVCALVGACATTGVNKGQLNLISTAEEAQLGRQLASEIEKEIPMQDDAEVNAYIQRLGDRLAKGAPEHTFKYTFRVTDLGEVNAFAFPGGFIFVNRGLIETAGDEAELVAVLAHEMNHVVARHATERLSTMYGASTLTSILLGQNPAAWEQLVAQVVGGLLFLKYSRSQEAEADRLGLMTMVRAGWDPQGMVDFFERLAKITKSGNEGTIERMLSTHPLTNDRIKAAKEMIKDIQLPEGLRESSDAFANVQARLDELPPPAQQELKPPREEDERRGVR